MTGEATGDAGLPLVERLLTIGGRQFRVWAVEDAAALLALSETREPFPFGLLLWEGAVALAGRLADVSVALEGRRVLELGCGVGLAGLIAASRGALVTATDHDPLPLEVARRNAMQNDVAGIDFVEADWDRWSDHERYDLIIGADVTYDRQSHEAVLSILERNLAPGGTAILADPAREEQATFVGRLRARGFSVVLEARTVEDLVRWGLSVDVTLLTIKGI